VSSPSHPVEQVAFHVFDLSTCIYILIMLITVTFIVDSSTSRQLENLMVQFNVYGYYNLTIQ